MWECAYTPGSSVAGVERAWWFFCWRAPRTAPAPEEAPRTQSCSCREHAAGLPFVITAQPAKTNGSPAPFFRPTKFPYYLGNVVANWNITHNVDLVKQRESVVNWPCSEGVRQFLRGRLPFVNTTHIHIANNTIKHVHAHIRVHTKTNTCKGAL